MSLILRPQFFLDFSGPCVYVWHRGNKVLYVGSSKSVLARLNSHEIVGCIEEFQPEDFVEIHRCMTIEDMREVELRLVNAHQPKYNVNGLRRRSTVCMRCGKTKARPAGAYCSSKCRSSRSKVS